MERYIKKRHWFRGESIMRMVNQPEIVDYISKHPLQTEREIMYNIYRFVRGGVEPNKKYAECLRRALHSGKIARVKKDGLFKYYIPTTKTFTEWCKDGSK